MAHDAGRLPAELRRIDVLIGRVVAHPETRLQIGRVLLAIAGPACPDEHRTSFEREQSDARERSG